nr:MAG: ORF1 [Torque teno midi virus]
MPFWWGRRGKWWSGRRYRYRRRRRRPYRRRTRKTVFRRRHSRTYRRRRKGRRTKVRRKRKLLKLFQWQPESIRKCKIKGFETLLLGANGKQFRDYTSAMNEWIPPTVPGGGGLSISIYSLEYLYEQYKLHQNIWTSSNIDLDLCRYTGCKLIFFRHPYVDFVVHYKRTYPMTETAYTPMNTHPLLLLQQQHKIIIPSRITKPHGKNYIVKKIKPPTQQTNKWFFTREFSKTPLLLLQASACDLNFVKMGRQSENTLTNIYSLSAAFYSNGNMAYSQGTIQYYRPVHTLTYETGWITGTGLDDKTFNTNMVCTYASSVGYSTGWFSPKVLTAKSFTKPILGPNPKPMFLCRYNPNIDTGKGNKVYLKNIFNEHWGPPAATPFLIVEDEPLWLSLYGWLDYINTLKPEFNIYTQYTLVIQSKFFQTPTTAQFIIPIDESFITGKSPYNATITDKLKNSYWIPTLQHQQQSINNLVKCGPFITRPEGKLGNWELHTKYCFYFKWGGALSTEKTVLDPTTTSTYPVPDKYSQAIQITDPTKQIPQQILHSWDFRRGIVTQKALKRMYEHLSDATTVSTDSDGLEPPQKTKKSSRHAPLQEKETEVLQSLQQLFEKDSSQEEEEKSQKTIQELIKQQKQQQLSIKHNLLTLITHLRQSQMQMQLQTGILQ